MTSKLRTWAPAAAAMAALAAPAVAAAHPGHALQAGFASGFAHPWSGVDHVLAMTAVGLFAASLGGRALWAVPVSFVALMALGGGLGATGLALPFVEAMIGLSVLLFGLAVAARKRWPTLGAMAFVAVFAVFHGHAHAAEAGTAGGGAFGAGFLLATALLHLVGIAAARAAGALAPAWTVRLNRVGGAAIALAGAALLAGG